MHSIRSIRLHVRFDGFSIFITSWTALGPSCQQRCPACCQQRRSPSCETPSQREDSPTSHADTLAAPPEETSLVPSIRLGSCKLISNHIDCVMDYGLHQIGPAERIAGLRIAIGVGEIWNSPDQASYLLVNNAVSKASLLHFKRPQPWTFTSLNTKANRWNP